MSQQNKDSNVTRNSFTLTGWAALLSLYAVVGVLLWCVLVLTVCVSLLWVGIPLTVGAIAWIRGFANFHRNLSKNVIGISIKSPYVKQVERSVAAKFRGLFSDAATMRDQWWLLANGTAGVALVFTIVALFVYGLWCLVFPYVYSQVSSGALNDTWIFFKVHSQSSAFWTIPVGIVVLVIWWIVAPKLMRAYANLTKSLLQ